ncbi:MAG: hypothetical protein CM1200mP2_02810 [Planctomycetaceae bacterium]|nr:MAG: hypothetical protein CM1200mP2_02810 [Planctomycetaceae bacterium]
MRPQLMHNRGGGRFVEIDSESLGGLFREAVVGTGLARGDFDRDGRPDFAVSHLDDPSAVLANRTEAAGHWLAIRLVARRSARDAIGAGGDRAERFDAVCSPTDRRRRLPGVEPAGPW